jgi:hypothetical protein
VSNYKVKIQVDQQWLDILGQISKHQEGFIWLEVKEIDEGDLAHYYVKQLKESSN